MTMITYGNTTVKDLTDVQPHEVHVSALERRLSCIQRFGGEEKALTVLQHGRLVERMAKTEAAHAMIPSEIADAVVWWARYHDHHEGIIGDIIGPVKRLINRRTPILFYIEDSIDNALRIRLNGPVYTQAVRQEVHRIDKAAETIEWMFALGNARESWNAPVHDMFMADGPLLIEWARLCE